MDAYHSITSFIAITFLCCSCSTESEPVETEVEEKIVVQQEELVEFETELRPGQAEFDLTKIYSDTVVFDGFSDEYDYWYAFVKTASGETATLARDEPISNDLTGSKFLIEWKIDSLYEAGEGDELYYKERLLNFTILERSYNFTADLREFFLEYAPTQIILGTSKFRRNDIEVSEANNPGAACVLMDMLGSTDYGELNDFVVQEGVPQGDFCEGYPGVENGLYWETISDKNIPKYVDVTTEDWSAKAPPLPDVHIDAIYKVTVVWEEFQSMYYYFLKIDNQAYIWIIDKCDCSA